MRHFLYPEEGPRSILFTRHRFLGKNKQERPCSEAKRRDACPRKTMRVEQKKSAILLVREQLHLSSVSKDFPEEKSVSYSNQPCSI